MLEGIEGVEVLEVRANSSGLTVEHVDPVDLFEHLDFDYLSPEGLTILPPMLRDRVLHGMWIGLVAAAATAGALVGFGTARDAPVQPLNAIAHVIVGSRAFYVQSAHFLVTGVAVLVHLVAMALSGVAFAWAFGRWRGARLWVAATAFAALVALIDFVILPDRFSPGFESVLTRGEVVVVYAVMALAFAIAASRSPVRDTL